MRKKDFNTSKVFHVALNWLLFFVLFAGSLYIASVVMTSFFSDVKTSDTFSLELKQMSIKMFDVLKPFIEIVIIVWISDFVLRRLNINISNNLSSNNWNAKKIVVLSLLFAFIIASLVLTQVTVYLKGVILVFIGIFIGVNLEAVKFVLGMLNVNRHLTDYDAREQ